MGRWSQNFRSFGSPEFATLGFKAYCFEMFVLKRDWGFPSGTRKTAAHPSTFLPLLRGDPMLLSVYDHSGYKKKKKKRSCNFQVLFALCLLPTELKGKGCLGQGYLRGGCYSSGLPGRHTLDTFHLILSLPVHRNSSSSFPKGESELVVLISRSYLCGHTVQPIPQLLPWFFSIYLYFNTVLDTAEYSDIYVGIYSISRCIGKL